MFCMDKNTEADFDPPFSSSLEGRVLVITGTCYDKKVKVDLNTWDTHISSMIWIKNGRGALINAGRMIKQNNRNQKEKRSSLPASYRAQEDNIKNIFI